MFLCIRDVLTAPHLARITELFNRQDFVDGRATAGLAGAAIKSNLQVSNKSPDYPVMNEIVTAALQENRLFSLSVIPKRMRPLRFARYEAGMYYGQHTDNAVMDTNAPMRVDLAFTVFLSDPESYEGGELVVEEPGERRTFKLPAGAAVVYPSNTLHHIAQVTSGRRDVAVGWAQSMVRDPEHRRIIYELEDLRVRMLTQNGRTPEFDVLSRNVAQLWHMWVET